MPTLFPERLRAAAFLFLLCTLPAAAQNTPAGDTSAKPSGIRLPVKGIAASDGFVYLPGSPEMVAASHAKPMPNPTGRYTLVICDEESLPPGPAIGHSSTGGGSLLIWDSLARRAHTYWEQPSLKGTRQGDVGEAGWLQGTNCLLALVETSALDAPTEEERAPVYSLLFADVTRDSHARPLYSSPEPMIFTFSPALPLAAVTIKDHISEPAAANAKQSVIRTRSRVVIVDMRGRFTGITFASDFPGAAAGWSEDGRSVNISTIEPESATVTTAESASGATPQPGRTVRHWYAMDATTGKTTLLTERPKSIRPPAPSPVNPPLRFVPGGISATAPGGDTGNPDKLDGLWLASASTAGNKPGTSTASVQRNMLLIAPDADSPLFLPDLSGILYRSHGALYSIPLVRLSATQFAEANHTALMRETMSNAKQIGLAMMMFAMDNGEKYPAGGDVAQTVGAYLRNSDVFNNPATGERGFTYSLHGEALSGIEAPSTTPMGYLNGPGGKAVVFADGHVKWINDPIPAL